MDNSKYYIFYDGECGFCNHWVQWILKNDTKDKFLFSSLQSEFGQKFLSERGLKNDHFDTLYLWKPNSFYLDKSQAVFAIARILGGVNAIFGHLNFFPKNIADFFYDQVALRRKKIMSSKCFLPTTEERKKFVGN